MQVCNVNDKNVIFEEKIASKKLWSQKHYTVCTSDIYEI
jgi:hypothetical protein